MPADIPYDYIASFRTIDEVLPYRQYTSGAKVEDNVIYKNKNENTNPVLRLEYDILNKEGFGIKRGFYEIRPNSDFTVLMFIQSGKVKAKIPVISKELISKHGNSYEWEDNRQGFFDKIINGKKQPSTAIGRLTEENTIVSPKRIMPELTEKEKKKRKNRFKKGIDPIEYIHSKAEMKYDEELKNYIIIWEKYNTRVIGVIKTE